MSPRATEEAREQLLALLARLVFLGQQIAEPLFKTVNEFQGRVVGQVSQQPSLLLGSEIVAMAAHQRDQTRCLEGVLENAQHRHRTRVGPECDMDHLAPRIAMRTEDSALPLPRSGFGHASPIAGAGQSG